MLVCLVSCLEMTGLIHTQSLPKEPCHILEYLGHFLGFSMMYRKCFNILAKKFEDFFPPFIFIFSITYIVKRDACPCGPLVRVSRVG